jgi:hypothetical protein
LARAVGPSIAAVLIHSSVVQLGRDNLFHHMSDKSLVVTFWSGGAIMSVAFLLAIYFARTHPEDLSRG